MYNSCMRIRLTKWGNSLGIRLPKIFAMQMGMKSGDEIMVDIRDQSLILSKTETLDQLLSHVSASSTHEETDTGDIRGREAW